MRQENKRNWTNVLALAAIASFANAEIKTDTYWAANHDFENATIGIKVVDGIVEGTSAALTQRIQSTWTSVGHSSTYMLMPNVERVMSVFPETKFNAWFPDRNAIYTYDSFLRAVGKFPAFCNEGNTIDAGVACKRELAALFAHIYYESNGLSEIEDPTCAASISVADCGFKTVGVTSPESSLFYERGPLRLKGDLQY